MAINSNKYKRLFSDTVLFAISSFGSKFLYFLLTPLYTSTLSTADYGIADMITTTINFIYPILTLAIAEATLRFALDRNESRGEVLGCSLLFTIVSSVILLIATPFVDLIGSELAQYWLYFMVIYFIFNIHNTLGNYLKGIGKTKHIAIQSILQALTIIGSNVVFLLVFKWGIKGYLNSMIAGHLVALTYMIVFGRIYRDIPKISLKKSTIKKMLLYSLPMIPTLLAWAANSSIDKYMIIGFVGLDANGLYSVAHKIPTLVTAVLSVFLQAWQLSAIENHGADDESSYYTKAYAGLNVVSVLGIGILILLTKPIASVLFALDFYTAWKFVPLLAIASMFTTLSGFLASAYRAAKKTQSLLYSVLIGAIINIILNIVLLKAIGTIGAAMATAISFALVWLIRIVLVQKIVRIRINIFTTVSTYVILTVLALIYTAEVPYWIVIYIIGICAVVLLNIKDIISIVKSMLLLVISKIKRR